MVTTKTLLVILAFVSFTRSVHATDESVEIPGSTKFSESLQTAAASEKALETLYVLIDGHVLLLGREDLVSVSTDEFEQILTEFLARVESGTLSGVNGLHELGRQLNAAGHSEVKGVFPIRVELKNGDTTQAIGNQQTTGVYITQNNLRDETIILDRVNSQIDRYDLQPPRVLLYRLQNFIVPASDWIGSDLERIAKHASVVPIDDDRMRLESKDEPKRKYEISYNMKDNRIEKLTFCDPRTLVPYRVQVACGVTTLTSAEEQLLQSIRITLPQYSMEFAFSDEKLVRVSARCVHSVYLDSDSVVNRAVPGRKGDHVIVYAADGTESDLVLKHDVADVNEVLKQRGADR